MSNMRFVTLVLWCAVPLFAWAGVGCLVGIARFRYWPLMILGIGYLSWVASFILMLLLAPGGSSWPSLVVTIGLFLNGALCIFGYRFTFYPKMRERGISPKKLFGFGSS
jgi:hypothetical protein